MKFGPRIERSLRSRPKGVELLGSPETDKKFHFDPDREILSNEWEEARELLRKLREKKKRTGEGEYLDLAANLEQLSPGRITEIKEDEEMRKKNASITLNRKIQKKHSYYLSDSISYFRTYPEHCAEIRLEEKDWELLRQRTLKVVSKGLDYQVISLGHLGWLFPEKIKQWEERWKIWEDVKKRIEIARQKRDWGTLLYYLTSAKVAFPEESREIEIDQSVWDYAKEWFEKGRKGKDWKTFFRFAADLQILSADSVQVHPNGYAINNHGRSLPQRRPLPERSFS